MGVLPGFFSSSTSTGVGYKLLKLCGAPLKSPSPPLLEGSSSPGNTEEERHTSSWEVFLLCFVINKIENICEKTRENLASKKKKRIVKWTAVDPNKQNLLGCCIEGRLKCRDNIREDT